jgi:hypothetical protein
MISIYPASSAAAKTAPSGLKQSADMLLLNVVISFVTFAFVVSKIETVLA